MKNITVFIIVAVMCMCTHAEGKEVLYTITTNSEVIPDNAKGSQFRNQVSELASMISVKRFSDAEKLANELRSAYEAEFDPRLKQYSFQSQAEFDEFRKTSSVQFEWIDWGYQACLHWQAFIKSEKGDFLGALEMLNYVEQVAPFSALSVSEKGHVLNKLGNFEGALSTYRKALALSVKFTSQRVHRAAALRGLGFALIELKRFDEAESVFQESLEIEPQNHLALNEISYIQSIKDKKRISKNCQVNDPDVLGFYIGDCVAGVAHGNGIAKGRDEYQGEFKNGNKHGKGTYTWGANSRFAGQIFVGESIDDEFIKGVWTYQKENIVKEGTFKNAMLNGSGTYRSADGSIAEGTFKDDKLNGIGTIKIPRELLPDQKESNNVKLVGNYWVAQGVFRDDQLTDDKIEDNRTPLDKYQGAYTGAWFLCTLTQKMVFLTEKSKVRGISLDSDKAKTDSDVSICIENGLAEMKKEYSSILPLVKNPEGKKALQEHYVAAIMHVKGTHSRLKENDTDFTERMNETKRKTDELWVRFEITQP